MLSLLAFTNSETACAVESLLTSALDVRIELATDVDHALQEVFSKRPKVVCVHNEIEGITAEGFARHVQKMLGAKSPTFVLMHSGEIGIEPIEGVFDYLINLALPQEELAAQIESALAPLLSPELAGIWPAPEKEPEEQKDDEPFVLADSLNELMVELRDEMEGSQEGYQGEQSAEALQPFQVLECAPAAQPVKPATPPVTPVPWAAKPGTLDPAGVGTSPPLSKASAAPFDIPAPAGEVTPEKKTQLNVAAAALVVVLATAAVVYFVPAVRSLIFTPPKPVPQVVPVRVKPVPAPLPPPAVAVVVPPVKEKGGEISRPAAPVNLPSFIPLKGHDPAFSESNPGWERYLGKAHDFRVFTADNRIKAVQVLGIQQNDIPTEVLKMMLLELTGSAEYRQVEEFSKGGYLVMRGKVGEKADLLTYSIKKKRYAVVISLN